MRYVLEDIEAGKLTGEIERRGVRPRQRVRAVVETLDDDLPMAKVAEEGRAFEFLADEPDVYAESDIKT
ncbi:MAG: hypothetical protein WDN08_10835 [Rhizomicrobium sp.]